MKATEGAGIECDSTLGSDRFGLFSFALLFYRGKDFLSLAQQQPSQLPQLHQSASNRFSHKMKLRLPSVARANDTRSQIGTLLRLAAGVGTASLPGPPLSKSAAFQ